MAVSERLRKIVAERAQGRCEYCGLSQAGQEATFHVDHVIPVASGGKTETNNLALACVSCSLRKGAREWVEDPDSCEQVKIFNPRKDKWEENFEWDGTKVYGLTPTGRATISALALNREVILAIRNEEASWDRHPPH